MNSRLKHSSFTEFLVATRKQHKRSFCCRYWQTTKKFLLLVWQHGIFFYLVTNIRTLKASRNIFGNSLNICHENTRICRMTSETFPSLHVVSIDDVEWSTYQSTSSKKTQFKSVQLPPRLWFIHACDFTKLFRLEIVCISITSSINELFTLFCLIVMEPAIK